MFLDKKTTTAKAVPKKERNKEVYHHVGIYSYTLDSLQKFIALPKSNNEITLKLEQYRAMDAGMSVGITFEPNIPPSTEKIVAGKSTPNSEILVNFRRK